MQGDDLLLRDALLLLRRDDADERAAADDRKRALPRWPRGMLDWLFASLPGCMRAACLCLAAPAAPAPAHGRSEGGSSRFDTRAPFRNTQMPLSTSPTDDLRAGADRPLLPDAVAKSGAAGRRVLLPRHLHGHVPQEDLGAPDLRRRHGNIRVPESLRQLLPFGDIVGATYAGASVLACLPVVRV